MHQRYLCGHLALKVAYQAALKQQRQPEALQHIATCMCVASTLVLRKRQQRQNEWSSYSTQRYSQAFGESEHRCEYEQHA